MQPGVAPQRGAGIIAAHGAHRVHAPASPLHGGAGPGDRRAQAFALNPRLRGYVLDDQGHLRANVVVYIDGRASRDRRSLSDALRPASSVYVLQALSGG